MVETIESSIRSLIQRDLNLKEVQFEIIKDSGISDGSAVCIVHHTWLKAAQRGEGLPSEPIKLSSEHLHWLMQPSCGEDRLPAGWCIVRTLCLCKEGISTSDTDGRTLTSPRWKWSTSGFNNFLSQVACQNQQVSWRQYLDDTHPLVRQKPLNQAYLEQLIEELFGVKFIRIGSVIRGGGSSHEDREESILSGYSNCCPSNITSMISALESDDAYYFITPHYRHNLFDLVTHSPSAIGDSTSKPLFVFYQLLQLLKDCHERGVTLGEFGLHDVCIDNRLWVNVYLPLASLCHDSFEQQKNTTADVEEQEEEQVSTDDDNLSLCEALYLWQKGEMSNLDYILCLNRHAGRKLHEPNNHPVVPWVIDFIQQYSGYRDLSKSKHRLNKGDQQLDFTYQNAKDQLKANPHIDQVFPHHVGDLLSDVTYYMYLSRQTPKELLCSRVRPRWVPGEYPSSIQKLYEWTPDECIPEFYTDPNLFKSIHDDLADLAVPTWCSDVDDFVKYHRSVLEGDYVSAHLHNWIDIIFGYKLQGDPAVKAKNIHLSLVDGHTTIYNHGIVQLFNSPHPKKMLYNPAPYAIEQPLYNPFGTLQLNTGDAVISMVSPTKKKDAVQRIKGIMSSKELQEHLEQPTSSVEEPVNSTIMSLESELSDEHGFLDVSVHYPEIMSAKASVPNEKKDGGLLPFSLWTPRLGVPKVVRMRQRRPVTDEVAALEYSWQQTTIPLPKDFSPIQHLSMIEETGLFTSKVLGETNIVEGLNKKDFCSQNEDVRHELVHVLQKKYDRYQLSYEEQVAVDTFSALCIAVEMCCGDQLRARMPQGASLLQRLTVIIQIHKREGLDIPDFLTNIINSYFSEDFSLTGLTAEGLPGISASLILQQFVPSIRFPPCFSFLYTKLSELNCYHQTVHSYGEDIAVHVSALSHYLSSNVHTIAASLDHESLDLLLLHLKPFFTDIRSSFDSIMASFESLAEFLSHEYLIRIFSPWVQTLFDHTVLEPHCKAQLFHRPFLNTVIRRMGLAHFLDRYISHIVEAVINPSGVHSNREQKKGRKHDSQSPGPEHEPATGEAISQQQKRQLSLLLDDVEPEENNSDDELEDNIGETYTSILAQTPVEMTTPKQQHHDPLAMISERSARTRSDSMDGVITMEPILVVSPPAIIDDALETPTGLLFTEDNTLTRNMALFSSSPDISGDPPVFDQVSDVMSDKDLFVNEESDEKINIDSDKLGSIRDDNVIDGDRVEGHDDKDHDRLEGDSDREGDNDDKDEDRDIASVQLSNVDVMLAEVAVDSLRWLMHRLGPLLASRYIIRPLLDGLYRCFTSQYSDQEVAVLKCLSHFANTYGPPVIKKMYIPHAESLIKAAGRHLNHKSEGGLLSALAILQLCFEYMSEKSLEENMLNYCGEIFHPITQFICSPSYIFTLGWKLRLRLCHLFIGTISYVGKKLGREGALQFLSGTLQLFFAGFDVVYGVGLVHKDNSLLSNIGKDTESPSPVTLTVEDTESAPLVSKAMLSATPSKLARNLGSHLRDDTEGKENFLPIQQLCRVFTPKLAHAAYVKMCLVLGQLNLRRELYNTELVEQITYSHDETMQDTLTFPQPSNFVPSSYSSDQSGYTSCDNSDDDDLNTNSLGPFIHDNKGLSYDETDYGRSSWFVDLSDDAAAKEKRPERSVSSGHLVTLDEPDTSNWPADDSNQSQIPLGMHNATFETRFGGLAVNELSIDMPPNKNNRKLRGLWAALWEERCQNFRSPYKFHNIKLQTYIGHKAVVKSLCVPDDEHCFFSASKDRTVKIWSLGNRGDEMEMYQCQRTYSEHQRSLIAVDYIQNLRQVVSCDSTLHLWDAETGYCIRQVSAPTQGTMFTSMATVPLAFQPVVALGTTDCQLQFLDLRSKSLVHKWKVLGLEPNGVVKCISSDYHLKWLAVGSSNDIISTLDPRTGEVFASWKTSEFSSGVWKAYSYTYETDSILQLKGTRRGLLISSTGSGVTSLWKPKAGNLVHHIKVSSPAIHCLELNKDSLIAVNSSNQIFIYRSYEFYNQTASPTSYKLPPKVFKGNISSVAFLPNNQTLLMGSDTGQIVLMA